MALRHFKYTYNAHIPPKLIISKMLQANIVEGFCQDNTKIAIDFESKKNKLYFSLRKQLKNLMKKINSYIENNSQTYFLTLYYMDLIFTHKDLQKIFYSHFNLWYNYPMNNNIQNNHYVLLSLACLVVASKFNENDPQVPSMSSYLRLLYEFSNKKFIFNLYSLFLAEMVVMKILKYKLNFYTIYHYLIFFFTHGILLKKTFEKSKYFKKISGRKILEKIYIQVREIFDEIIEDEKYYDLYMGKNNYEIVVEILLWSMEHILEIKINDDENIFKLIWGINISPNKKKEMHSTIEELYSKIFKRNHLCKSTQVIELDNDNNINKDIKNQTKNIFPRISSIPQAKGLNHKINILPKSSITSSTTLSNTYSFKKPPNPNKISSSCIQSNNINENNFLGQENIIIKNEELNNYNNKYNSNLNYSYRLQNSAQNKNIYPPIENYETSIQYGPNNRIYLSTGKNIQNLSYNLNFNSLEKMIEGNDITSVRIHSNREIKAHLFKLGKEPSDNKKGKNEIKNKYIDDVKGGKILINNNENVKRKKSLSYSKKMMENLQNNEKYEIKQSIKDVNNFDRNLQLKEKINNTNINIPLSSKELNNYYFQQKALNGSKNHPKKEIILKVKKSRVNNYNNFQLHQSSKPITKTNNNNNTNNEEKEKEKKIKIIKDNKVNRIKYNKKLNNTLDKEPQDNYKRKSVNKRYSETESKINSINKNNNSKTIIINNNIHINTMIDNTYLNQDRILNKSQNIFLYENSKKDPFQ